MKNRFVLIILIFLFIGMMYIYADSDHDKSIKGVLKEIRKELGLKDNEKIDPDKVFDQLLEELGEAVMDERIPNERQHEWMDNMMGGEDSESLAAMHRNMGYNYLSGNYVDKNYWSMPMMGGGNMMWNGFGGMMGGYRGFYGFGGIIMGILFLVILGFVIYFVYLAIKKNNFSFSNSNERESPLEILKKRYAKGEITKDEFEKIKKDIL